MATNIKTTAPDAGVGAAERAARSGSSPDQLFGDTEAARED
jgi:hypothetical protein